MTMSHIHPSAIVSSDAQLGQDVEVGPFTIIESSANIGAGTKIGAHSVIHSWVAIGDNCKISDHVVLGGAPQDISYQGDETWLQIGDNVTIREYCSIHRSTNPEQATTVGDEVFMMCNSHLGHDCQVGKGVIITAFAGISGHVNIGDRAVIGGSVGIHQFCRIGSLAMVGAYTPVGKDVLPFSMLGRDPVAHYKLNMVGLRRAGIKGERYRALEKAMQLIRAGKGDEIEPDTEELEILQHWLAAPSKRGIYKFAR